ncbi:MAG: pitrilysin family protein [Thermodesulfobacteriota bacterium]
MYRKTILDNGIRVVTEHIPYVRSVSMGIWVTVGSRDEAKENNGISHFIEHMIFKGTAKRSALQIAKELDAVGGMSNAFTSRENTCFHARVLDTHVDVIIDLLSDIFLNSLFDPAETEKERQVILQEISMVEDTPDDYIHDLFSSLFWGDNPLGFSVLGTARNVMQIDSQTIHMYLYKTYSPDKIVVAAAGNLEHDAFLEQVRRAFSIVPGRNGVPERVAPAVKSRLAVHPKKCEQVNLILGTKSCSATDRRRYACMLLNIILGGSMSSRLFQEIRERRGLAYTIYSFISSYMDTGLSGIYAGVSRKNAVQTIELILREMQNIKKNSVDEAELASAKEHLKGGLLLAAESSDNRMTRLAKNEIHFGHFITYDELITQIDAVTREDIAMLAHEYLSSETLSLTVLGPVSEKDIPGDILSL